MATNGVRPEEAMIPPSLEPNKIKEINHPCVEDIDRSLAQLIRLNENDVFHEPSCLICSSANRTEIEQKHLEGKSHDETKKFCKSMGVTVSDIVIDNHMLFHVGRGVRERVKVEYIDAIRRLNSVDLTTLDRIQFMLSALTERLTNINSLVPNKECSEIEVEKIKSDATAKISQAFEKYIKLQAAIRGEMKDEGDLIILPKNAFIQVVNETILDAKSDDARNSIKTLLNRLTSLSKLTQ